MEHFVLSSQRVNVTVSAFSQIVRFDKGLLFLTIDYQTYTYLILIVIRALKKFDRQSSISLDVFIMYTTDNQGDQDQIIISLK